MPSDARSWGILGNPSPEKIEEYKNMPVGAFREMVKDLKKKNKNKNNLKIIFYHKMGKHHIRMARLLIYIRLIC